MPTKSWYGKTAVICGASSGLGREIAKQLAEQQVARLVLIARTVELLEQLQAELQSEYVHTVVSIAAVDMCETEQVKLAVASITQDFGNPDLVIQAVGMSDRGRICDLEESKLALLFHVNVQTSLNAIRAFHASMKSPGGTIVLIGSLASLFAPRFLGGYAIAKHALAALAQQARLELADSGIHILLACPGPIAREDGGRRYADRAHSSDMPSEALKPGGGAKVRGLDPQKLARDILQAAATKKKVIIRPRKARILLALAALSPTLGDFLLRRKTS